MLVIVDTGVANRYSIRNAFEYIGCSVKVSCEIAEIRNASQLVFPGVGAFSAGMSSLKERRLIEVIREEVTAKGKPVLGICLGMQMLAGNSLENGDHEGLGIIPGTVRRIQPDDPALKVPHVGFNAVDFAPRSKLAKDLPVVADFYFVHSYFVDCDPALIAGTFDHGGTFAAVIEHANILATQFHPEKSQRAGLQVLRNFVNLG